MSKVKIDHKRIAESVRKIAALLDVAKRNPAQPDNYMQAARLCWQIDERERALKLLMKSFDLAPANQRNAMILSHALVNTGQSELAREVCHRHLEIIRQEKLEIPFIETAEATDIKATPQLPTIDIEGYLVDPEESWFDLVFAALIGTSQHRRVEQYYREKWNKNRAKEEILLDLANAAEFKKQGVSWLVCGQAKRFISASEQFWRAVDSKHPISRKEDAYILVSFLHPDPTNKVRNGFLGKYLQHRDSLNLMAIGRDDNFVEINNRLADAFGMEKCLSLKTKINFGQDCLADHVRTGGDLRRDLLMLNIGGIKVGDLIYDEYLRCEMACTITQVDERLEAYYHEAKALKSYYDEMFNTYPIKRVVMDHSVYLQWGILARTALQKGVPVLTHHGRSSPIIGRLHPPNAGSVEYEVKIAPSDFNEIYHDFGDELAPKGLAIVERYYVDRKAHKHSLVSGDNHRIYNRIEIMERLGLDTRKPVVFIMAHTMSDAPHFLGSLLFDDYFHWLKATLDMARAIKQVNWIIKEHPFASTYTGEHSALKMVSTYEATTTHMRGCPLDFHPGGLIDCADAVVTARGTAGLEAAVFGKPVVLAGESPYSGHGFTIEPQNIEAYQNALSQLVAPAQLKDVAVQRARCFAYLYFEASRVDCLYLPYQPLVALDPIPDDLQWKAMADRLSNSDVTQDPLYRNLMIQLDSGYPHMFDFDKVRISRTQGACKQSGFPLAATV